MLVIQNVEKCTKDLNQEKTPQTLKATREEVVKTRVSAVSSEAGEREARCRICFGHTAFLQQWKKTINAIC